MFLSVRFLPMPSIKNVERLLVRSVQGVPNFYQARPTIQSTLINAPVY